MTKPKFSIGERRAQILAAARTLFAKSGYAEVTVDEIAAQVGISRPRVVQIFGSKQRIYETIAEEAYKSHPMDEDLAEPIGRKDDFGVFRAFALHVLSHTRNREDREIFKILMHARLREDQFHRTHFHRKDTLMMSRLSDYVTSRVEDGEFRRVDPRTVVCCFQAMVSNLVIYKNVLDQMNFVTIEQLSRECARIFLEGLRTESGQVCDTTPAEAPSPRSVRSIRRKRRRSHGPEALD